MKIYEVTNQPPSKKILAQELSKIYEADAPPDPGFFSKLGRVLHKSLKLFSWYEALWKPFDTYLVNMQQVEANLTKAGNTPAAIAEFNEQHELQMGQLIAGISAGIIVSGILGSLSLFGKFLQFIPGIGGPLGKTIGLLSDGARAWILYELQSEKARSEIAKLVIITGLNYDNDLFGVHIHEDFVNITQIIGRLGNTAHDYFEDLFRRAIGLKELDKPINGKDQLDPNAPPPTPPLTPAQDASLTAQMFSTNKPVEKELPVPGEYLGSRLQRNPVTGRVEMKSLQ